MSLDTINLAGTKAKGKRPQYFDHPDSDRLMSITLALAGELAVTRERLDTLERILAANGALKSEDIESFKPNREQAAERGQWHQEFIARIFRYVQQEIEAIDEKEANGDSVELKNMVDELAKI